MLSYNWIDLIQWPAMAVTVFCCLADRLTTKVQTKLGLLAVLVE